MALDEILQRVVYDLGRVEKRIEEIESRDEVDAGDLLFGTALPTTDLFPNRMYCLTTDPTGGPGGTLYRYDSTQGSWLRIS